MNNPMFLIPANSNNGKLIFSLFTKLDLIIVVVGFSISLLCMLIFKIPNITVLIIFLIPMLVSAALVMPIPYYHNVLVVLRDIIEFFYNRRNYKWEGWCCKDEYK